MLTSARRGILYPNTTRVDTADVPRDIAAVIAALEIDVLYGQGTFATRPVSTPGSPGMAGRIYVATDLTPHAFYYDYGTGWDQINSTATAPVSVLSAAPVLEPGITGQKRAGRVLTAADFTALLGLSAPVALWNLSDLTDASGNARALTNKGAVAFGKGITGTAAEAAAFTGNVGQALYINDAGAGDPFRLPAGSWGCWFKTAKKGTVQNLITKANNPDPAASSGFELYINASNNVGGFTSNGTGFVGVVGVSNVCDDRWHYAVLTYDGGLLSLYVDGTLEGTSVGNGPINSAASGPLNIGGMAANGGTNALNPFFGCVDEAFITQDVLSEDQVRMLYAVKIAHGASYTPASVATSVRRQRKGAALAQANFPTAPLRIYNFVTGSLNDTGTAGSNLTANNAPVSVPSPDGLKTDAYFFKKASSQWLGATDAGLPAAAAARSVGMWFKADSSNTNLYSPMFVYGGAGGGAGAFVIYLGGAGSGQQGLLIAGANGSADIISAFRYDDGQWHHVVVTYDAAAADGLKYKMYVDGKLIASNTTAITANTVLAGANGLRIGTDAASFFNGSLSRVFVANYALTGDDVAAVYALGSLALGASPKNEGDHVEQIDATNLYLIYDTLESQQKIDLRVAA